MLFGLVIIALTFLAKPWIGILIAAIIFYDYFKRKKKARTENNDLWPKICEMPGTTPDEILLYKGCTVEIYKNLNITRIIKPNGKDLGASFKDVPSAIKNIDEHVK